MVHCLFLAQEIPMFTSQPSSQSVDLTKTTTLATGDSVNYDWKIGSGSLPSKVTVINTNTYLSDPRCEVI